MIVLALLVGCGHGPEWVKSLPGDDTGAGAGDSADSTDSGDSGGGDSGDTGPVYDGECSGPPTDGAGCVDPGWPAFPDPVTSVQITLVTRGNTNDGSDDPLVACVGDGLCWGLDVADWNDREPGQADVHHLEGLSIPRSEVDRFRVYTSDGSDMWVPEAFAVSLDGEPVYCQRPSGVYVGDDSGETLDWTDPAGLGLHCASAWASPLTHGPMVGAVEPDAVRLWYRTDATRRVLMRFAATEAELADARPVHYGYPSPSDDFTDEVRISGLSPSTTWAWDLEIDGVRHGPWSVTTAPAPDAAGVTRIAFGSCTKEDEQPAFGAVLDYDPDLYLFLGDNHYANSADLPSLRQWYRWAHSRDERSTLLSRASVLSTWDDHDYTGNNTDGTADGKEHALRAFGEYWANAQLGTAEVPGVFHAARWGDVALVFVDDRYWRGLDDSVPGDAQEAWLVDAITSAGATFVLVASGSQWTLQGTGDSWAVWPEAQERFLEAITAVPGVVLLSGDVHRSEFRLLGEHDGYAVPELTSSGMGYPTPAGCTSDTDVVVCHDDGPTFVTLDIDTTLADPTLTAIIRDVDGEPVAAWTIHRSDLE